MNSLRISSIVIALLVLLSASACGTRVIVLKDPLTPEEHINLAVAYENDGELDSALKHYEAASKELPLAYLYMGNVYFKKDELGKAEKYYRKALKKMPENADTMNNLAWLYYSEGKNLGEAEELAGEALRIDPGSEIYSDTLRKIRALRRSRATP